MGSNTFFPIRELEPDERALIEKLIGRPATDEEILDISLVLPHEPLSAEERERAADELREAMDDFSKSLSDVPDEALEKALDDAMREARPRYRSIRE